MLLMIYGLILTLVKPPLVKRIGGRNVVPSILPFYSLDARTVQGEQKVLHEWEKLHIPFHKLQEVLLL